MLSANACFWINISVAVFDIVGYVMFGHTPLLIMAIVATACAGLCKLAEEFK